MELPAALAVADAEAEANDTDAVNDGILALALTPDADAPPFRAENTDAGEEAVAELRATGCATVPFVPTSAFTATAANELEAISAEVPVAGAYHQSVVTPTGNVYFACMPRNSIVAGTGCGFQVVLALSSLLCVNNRQYLVSRGT